jgi:histidinol dehydrogenase
MRTLFTRDSDYDKALKSLTLPSSLFDPEIEKRTRAIIESVRASGDATLIELTKKFDGADVASGLRISDQETAKAHALVDGNLSLALADAHHNVREFSKRSLRKSWSWTNSHGGVVGERFEGFERVGIYIPGGTAPLVSTALMTVTLAGVAGCKEIVVCTPCSSDGLVHPAILFAAKMAGATEIHRVGGAQAIAAMALGTQSIRPVHKVFGPGNAYVVMAKRLLFGHVSIDLLPGPSEILVLADDNGKPDFIAADLLAQAEQGSGHERTWLITPSLKLIRAVEKEIEGQIPALSRRTFIEKALAKNGWLIQARSIQHAIDLTNAIAPEHCQVITRNAKSDSRQIKSAGAVFVGPYSPTVLGDYIAGPSHVLPTGGVGRSFSGLTVDQFQRRTSVVTYTKTSLKRSLQRLATLAEAEGLTAHAASARIRVSK